MSCWNIGCWGAGICTKLSNHLILCHPLLLLPSIFPSIRVFFNELGLCIRCPKYWSFSFNISPSSEYSGLISLRMDWLDHFHGSQPCSGKRVCTTPWRPEPRRAGHPTQKGHSAEFWQTVVHWERHWQLTPGFLLWVPHKQYKKVK